MDLQAAVQAYKQGDKDTARSLTEDVLALEPANEKALSLMILLANSRQEREHYMQLVMEVNPQNAILRKTMAQMRQRGQRPAVNIRQKRSPMQYLILGGVVIVGCVALAAFYLFSLSWTRDVSLTVTDYEWQRTIRLQELREFTVRAEECRRMDEDGVYNLVRRTPTSNPEGGDPIGLRSGRYDTCSYNYVDWRFGRTLEANGNAQTAPYWPEVGTLQNDGRPGSEREYSRQESYTVVFRDEDSITQTCPVENAEAWQAYPPGSRWQAPKTVLWGTLNCNALVPKAESS